MENQQTQTPTQTPVQPPTPSSVNKFVEILNNLPKKLMSNKKTLAIIAIVFGVFIVLLILINVITKSVKNIVKPNGNTSPTPTPEDIINNPQNVSTVSGELAPLQLKLMDLKDQINNLDVNQSRLKPPDINFKIDFQPKK